LIRKEKTLEMIKKHVPGHAFYPKSIRIKENSAFLIGKDSLKKYLFIISDKKTNSELDGKTIGKVSTDNNELFINKNNLIYNNLLKLKTVFFDLWPVTSEKNKSFGTGDRLGMVTVAHINAFKDRDIFPVLAQQSVRELERTQRNWKDVINSALWGYFEAGIKFAFGADADHIKETEDLKKAADAGFSMFTVDPSDYIEDISFFNKSEITKKYYSLEKLSSLENKYIGKSLTLGEKTYNFDQDILIPMVVKYKRAIDRVVSLYEFLKSYKKSDFDFEVSMDEIEESVSPLEHYFIVNELLDSNIGFNNLALRFVGRWEKAVDYMGDIKKFEAELKEHSHVLKRFGQYRLSLHSGSEKFSTYRLFSKICEGNFHIKTAGTSWLEALRTLAFSSPHLFRDIFNFSLDGFFQERKSYHLTTDTKNIPDMENIPDDKLFKCLDMTEPRQVLHVAFGSVLTSKDDTGKYLFRDGLYSQLFKNEELHYRYVTTNMVKHLDLLR